MEAKTLEPIKSPNENVAQKAVDLVQPATTKVKEAITLGIMQGQSPFLPQVVLPVGADDQDPQPELGEPGQKRVHWRSVRR